MKRRRTTEILLASPLLVGSDRYAWLARASGMHSFIIVTKRSRVLWNALIPILFHSNAKTAINAIQLIIRQYSRSKCAHTENTLPSHYSIFVSSLRIQNHEIIDKACDQREDTKYENNEETALPTDTIMRRYLRTYDEIGNVDSSYLTPKVLIWIEPTNATVLDYVWQGLLIHLENQLIQAQSFTGYLATLGGGFFLCHHFKTALVLAREQQKFAAFLHNDSMYYSCVINQIYNFIYSGHFGVARILLKQLSNDIAGSNNKPDSTVIKMYGSADLFLGRMRKAARSTKTLNEEGLRSKTIDDFQRIRVVPRDKSTTEDLFAPFKRLS